MKEILEEIIGNPALVEGEAWRRLRLEPNQVIVREGEPGRSLFLVESGRLRVTGRVRLEGTRRVQPGICDLEAGEVFGELGLFDSGPRTATVTAIGEAVVVELDAEPLKRFLDGHPEVGYRLVKALYGTLVERMRRTDRQLENLIAWGLRAHGIEEHL